MLNEFDDLESPTFDWIDWALLILFVLTVVYATCIMLELSGSLIMDWLEGVGAAYSAFLGEYTVKFHAYWG